MKVSAQLGRLRAGFSIALLAGFLPLQAQTPTNLLTNGSFETNNGSNAATGWTITNNLQSGPYGEFGLVVRPEAGASDGASFALWNAGDSTPCASIAQTFTTIPGASYTLKFDYVGGPSWRTDIQSLVVTVSNSDLATQIATGDSSGNWKTFSYTFKATGTSSTVTFSDNLSNNTISEDGALDNVVITANPVTVFASGISAVQTWDPIFPASAYADPSVLSTPTQTVGPLPNDPRWANPHAAFSFPKGTHPWDHFPATNAFGFDALWINSWSNISSRGAGGQSWTKYTTTVTGAGDFVLQFLADNVSWIYIDGALVGYQDWHWDVIGTGRYTIRLSGAGPHELTFVIWDGGGAAGGKFRLETTQSFLANGGGTLPPPPPFSDTTAPVITAPVSITKEATGPAGANVPFVPAPSATDNVDSSVTVTASPASGSLFAITTTTVRLEATDAAGNRATASFPVTVQDTTPPVLVIRPGNLVLEAFTSAGTTSMQWETIAVDAVAGAVPVQYDHSWYPAETYPIGTTTVNYYAQDGYSNRSTGSFTITVRDTIAPVLTVPANQTVEATSTAGAAANYAAATATDAVGVTSLTSSAASGSTFAIGLNTVTVTAKDAAGHTTTGSFTITVQDTIAPALTVPANQTLEATSAAGATATFAASASDAVGVTSLTYSAASGSTFAIGTTTVTVTAKDAAGHTTTGSFTVTVADTIAPVITVPVVAATEATSALGAIVNYAVATATDAVGLTSLTYSKASGTTFAIGSTTVTVTAKDAAGNTSTKNFTVTVKDSTAPVITATMTAKGGGDDESTQSFTIAFSATDLVGVKTLTAVLNGITVTNGQIVQLQTIKSGAQSVKRDDGKLQIKATAFALVVTATDAVPNTGTKTVVPVFVKNGKDDEDKKGDDKKDSDGKSSSDDKSGKKDS